MVIEDGLTCRGTIAGIVHDGQVALSLGLPQVLLLLVGRLTARLFSFEFGARSLLDHFRRKHVEWLLGVLAQRV